jgi:hypothetical protein
MKMEDVSKLQLIGDGEREIVYFDDMKYEVEGKTLKVYLTKQNQSNLIPLDTTSLHKEEEKPKDELQFVSLPIESKRLLFQALDLPTEGNTCHYCKEQVPFEKVSLMPSLDESLGWVLCDSPLCISTYLTDEEDYVKPTQNEEEK